MQIVGHRYLFFYYVEKIIFNETIMHFRITELALLVPGEIVTFEII